MHRTTTCGNAQPSSTTPSPDELAIAIRIGRRMLATYGTVGSRDIFAYAQAHGGLSEALRILLRALDAETTADVSDQPAAARCPAAHPDDPTPCDGPPVVTVLDRTNAGAIGCERHGARLLASLDGGRVYPLPDAPDGAAIRTFQAADATRPFPWVNGPRIHAAQLSRLEARRGGEGR